MARCYEFYNGYTIFYDMTPGGYNVGILHDNGHNEMIDCGLATLHEAELTGRKYVDEEL